MHFLSNPFLTRPQCPSLCRICPEPEEHTHRGPLHLLGHTGIFGHHTSVAHGYTGAGLADCSGLLAEGLGGSAAAGDAIATDGIASPQYSLQGPQGLPGSGPCRCHPLPSTPTPPCPRHLGGFLVPEYFKLLLACGNTSFWHSLLSSNATPKHTAGSHSAGLSVNLPWSRRAAAFFHCT